MDTQTEIIASELVIESQEQEYLPVVDDVYVPPAVLTKEEEDFALAIVETGGNIPAAYLMVFGPDSRMPTANGKILLANPAVALKIRAITEAVSDQNLISKGAHLSELARIRDLAMSTGNIKAALHAERSRGEVVGFYAHEKAGGRNTNAVQININMASKHDETI